LPIPVATQVLDVVISRQSNQSVKLPNDVLLGFILATFIIGYSSKELDNIVLKSDLDTIPMELCLKEKEKGMGSVGLTIKDDYVESRAVLAKASIQALLSLDANISIEYIFNLLMPRLDSVLVM
jgi:hypothetical protein